MIYRQEQIIGDFVLDCYPSSAATTSIYRWRKPSHCLAKLQPCARKPSHLVTLVIYFSVKACQNVIYFWQTFSSYEDGGTDSTIKLCEVFACLKSVL